MTSPDETAEPDEPPEDVALPAPLDPSYELAYLLKTLQEMGTAEGTIDEKVERLKLLQQIAALVASLSATLQETLAVEMTEDYELFQGIGWLVREHKLSTTGSNLKAARRDAIREAVTRAALDRSTGEIRPDWKAAAQAALDLLDQSITLGGPKQGFSRLLGLDPDEYITKSWYTKVSVKGTPE